MNSQGKRSSPKRVLQVALCLLCIIVPLVWFYNATSDQVQPTNNEPTPTQKDGPTPPETQEKPPPRPEPVTDKPLPVPLDSPEPQPELQMPMPIPTKPAWEPKEIKKLPPPKIHPPDVPAARTLYFPPAASTLPQSDLITLNPPKAREGDIQLECPPVNVPKKGILEHSRLPTIAYSIVMHKRPDLLRVWMHLTHDPDNFYMIHVDAKAPSDVYNDVVKLSQEYDNVKINPERYHTTYYGWSVMWNHISNYMRIRELDELRDYLINVSGMELPIQTRKEIRFFLGEHEPASFVNEYCVISEIRNYWVAWTWAEVKAGLVVVNKEARAVPTGVKLHYGSQYTILHRNIVEWMLEDLRMLHLSYWLRNTKSPEDIFFVTAARSSPYKNTVFLYNNMKYVENGNCCTGFQPSRSTPCSLGVCDMEKVDSADDPNILTYVIERLSARERKEEQTGMVKRIPLVAGQVLEPEYAPLPSMSN